MSLIVNLFAGPGTGKSTTMAGVFAQLKWMGVNCEMAPEFAKEKVWEESTKVLEDQIYVFGKQLHNIARLHGKVDVIVTDAPLLLSLLYGQHESKEFKALVVEVFNRYDNLNFFLGRRKSYNPSGRLQTEAEARALDIELKMLLNNHNQKFTSVDATPENIQMIADEVHHHYLLRKNLDNILD